MLEASAASFHDKYCAMVANGDYAGAYRGLLAETELSPEEKRSIIAAINTEYLSLKGLEWGNHGIRRTFRFWTDEQKIGMIRQANRLTDALSRFTPHVSFGFGSVLGFVRDGGFIPHDDDLDLIIALPSEGATFQKAKRELREFLEANGFTPHGFDGNFPTHFGVNEGNGTAVDVFIGFVEADRVAWFPSARAGMLVSDVFPTSSMTILGEEVRVPANPQRYLEVTYGSDWREPIANWHHPWDIREFVDFWEAPPPDPNDSTD
ncbi:LicD family protein [Aminobacter sp. SR38]|jgi:hypothetical protein|uniref:LicD family protein n=1 Tax=Aminobacter sp. SR38 TaxID=2774562 RepID=UPI0017830D7F|nr:LicD family protein [Aminobacter sp. SR38]QOF71484.1 LicD family protein [Aminobacter sp. SR38]